MKNTISAKQLRTNLSDILLKVANEKKQYTLIYRSKPVLKLVPLDEKIEEASQLEEIPKALQLGLPNEISKASIYQREDE